MGFVSISSLGRVKISEKFFVDTNIWVNIVYIANKAIDYPSPNRDKISTYSEFVHRVKQNGKLYTSALCLSELGHYIERESYKNYQRKYPEIDSIKKFRALPDQRKIIVKDIEQAWDDIKALAEILPFTADESTGDNIIYTLKSHPLDAYDALFLKTMEEHGIKNIISDDKDFYPVADEDRIDIYTM